MPLMEELRIVLLRTCPCLALVGCADTNAPVAGTTLHPGTTDDLDTRSSESTTPAPEPTPTTSDTGPAASSTTDDTSGSSTTTTGEPATLCGNGILDPGETCDLGTPHNWDQGACTSQCQGASCGDGLVFIGVETCDEGSDNDPGYGHCDPVTCQPGPRCGDAHLDPEEECDAGDPDGGGIIDGADVPCQPGCAWEGRLAFISSLTYDGDLGGLAGADLKCRQLAEARKFHDPERFKAWLSTGDESPLGRFSFAADPIVLPTGLLVAPDLAALISGGSGDGIRSSETGATLLEARVWTNTADTGASFSKTDHCAGWTSADKQFKARIGLNAVPKQPPGPWQTWHDERYWTSYGPFYCNTMAHLYCIED